MAKVREVDFADLERVTALTRSVGWPGLTVETWRRLWDENPAWPTNGAKISRGWVLEDDGRIVGYMSNLPQRYRFEGRDLLAATACNFVVSPEARGQSIQLVMAFAKQANVEVLLNTTASPQSSKVFQFFKFDRIPQPHYDRSYYWVTRASGFLNAALRKKGYVGALSRVGSIGGAPLLHAYIRARGRLPRFRDGRLTIKFLAAEEIGSEFDQLWQQRLNEGKKFLAYRDAQTLRWHFARAGRTNPPLVCSYQGDRLTGYLALARQDAPHLQLRRARITDLFVERDHPDTIRSLLAAAVVQARSNGADMAEIIGFPPAIQRLCEEFRPFTLWNEAWPFLYKAREPALHRALAAEDAWYACLYDGDGGL